MAGTQERFLDASAQYRTAMIAEQRAVREELTAAQEAVSAAENRMTLALARAHDAVMSYTDLALVTGMSRSTIQRRVEDAYGKLCQAGG